MRAMFACVCAIVLLVACDSPPAVRPSPTAPPPASPSPVPVPSTYTLSGVVRTTGNVPVSGAKVVVLGQELSASATTDGNGYYSISGVKASPLEGMSPLLSASTAGYFTDVEFANRSYGPISNDTQVDFTLAPLVRISLGEVISGTAPLGDPVCSHWGYGAGACQRFAVTVPATGTLDVTLSASVFNFDLDIVGPDGTFAVYSGIWASPLRVTVRVEAGSTYEIRVIGGWNPARDFELTTALR
jgi:hypothetical protein